MQNRDERARVLIVDDERMVADTLAKVFDMSGYEVRTAYSAEEGIETIAQWEPNLAVVDVMLPQMNGVEFSIVIRENHPDCCCLLFSGSEAAGGLMREAAARGHRFDILAKPAHPVEVLELVRRMLAATSAMRKQGPASEA